MEDYCRIMLEDFLKNSFLSVRVLVEKLANIKGQRPNRKVTLFSYVNDKKVSVPFEGDHFFLRGSVEYTNPHLTAEEIQGIIGIRLLETCGNYFSKYGLNEPNKGDVNELYEALKRPTEGYIVPYLLNTDDVEPDRYSINPLKNSIVSSGQSAFPVANVRTDQLKVDKDFVKKYEDKLISREEVEIIDSGLKSSNGSYLDFVDKIKYTQLKELTAFCGMNLSLYTLRMPLSTLMAEDKEGLLHHIISESHRDYESIEQAYKCMDRSINKRTTLLTVPHSKKGYGSKRAARGKIQFNDGKLQNVNVKYRTTQLYPNGIDPKDIAFAVADDNFKVAGEELRNYRFSETPSSPQFFLYSIGSPEDAALWHGVGTFASPKLLQSYSSARTACKEGRFIKDLQQKYNLKVEVPLQFNLVPEGMWGHPIYRNIDASIGSIGDLADLAHRGMRLEYLSDFK